MKKKGFVILALVLVGLTVLACICGDTEQTVNVYMYPSATPPPTATLTPPTATPVPEGFNDQSKIEFDCHYTHITVMTIGPAEARCADPGTKEIPDFYTGFARTGRGTVFFDFRNMPWSIEWQRPVNRDSIWGIGHHSLYVCFGSWDESHPLNGGNELEEIPQVQPITIKCNDGTTSIEAYFPQFAVP